MPESVAQETITINMLSYVCLRSRAGLAGFFDVLEAIPEFVPTHWGRDVRARNPYDSIGSGEHIERDKMIEQVSAHKGMFFTPGLRRDKGIHYEAYFDSFTDGLARVRFDFEPEPAPSSLLSIFAFADALADYFQPALGFVHRFWQVGEIGSRYNSAGRISIDNLQKYSLNRVSTRTWYGRHLMNLVGLPLLKASGMLVKEIPWGGVQIDLVERPWETEPEALAAAQERVMEILVTSGAYGDFADFFHRKPGACWVPLPNTRPILPLPFPQPSWP